MNSLVPPTRLTSALKAESSHVMPVSEVPVHLLVVVCDW